MFFLQPHITMYDIRVVIDTSSNSPAKRARPISCYRIFRRVLPHTRLQLRVLQWPLLWNLRLIQISKLI